MTHKEAQQQVDQLKKQGLRAETVAGVYRKHDTPHDIDIISRKKDLEHNKQIIKKYGRKGTKFDIYVPERGKDYNRLRTMLRSPKYNIIHERLGKGMRYKRHTLSLYEPDKTTKIYKSNGEIVEIPRQPGMPDTIYLPPGVNIPPITSGEKIKSLLPILGSAYIAYKTITEPPINRLVPILAMYRYIKSSNVQNSGSGNLPFRDPITGLITYAEEPEKIKKWRRKQKRGAIMKPSTFQKIVQKAREAGYDDPEAVAGRAYWNTVEAKYRERKGE